jgi:ribonuclease P/MRP protein subunit RPP1
MKFFDIHVHSAFSGGQSSIEQIAKTAKELGYAGFCFSAYFESESQIKKLKEEIARVRNNVNIGIFLGFEARDEKDLERLVAKRKMYDLLLVHGGYSEMNRLAVDTPQVDILTHPEHGRNDSGMNHVLAKLAARHRVAIELNFREVSVVSRGTRSKTLMNITKNAELARKFHAPIVACSGAVSHWEMKDPIVLSSFANILGLEIGDAKNTVSGTPEKILETSKERTSREWVIPGVKIVRGGND